MKLTRRDLLRGTGASFLLGAAGCSLFGGDRGGGKLTVRQENPYNAEPSLDRLADSWITPTRDFYVRGHGTMPEVDAGTYSLVVEGLVDQPLRLSLAELDRLPKVSVPATLECAGNRRSELSRIKNVAGVLWDAGAIGTAEWRGVRLSDLLGRAGVKPAAKYVGFEGLDTVTLKDRQTPFGGDVPIEKAQRPETILALEMNGAPLTREHGFPARAVVPGFIGARSVKWLGKIILSDRRSGNNFVARDYKLFPPEATAETVHPDQFEPILEYSLNSAICRPLSGQTVTSGRVQVSGYALAPGGAGLGRVEISADGGASWVRASLMSNDAPFTWRLWTAEVEVAPGPRILTVRATDSKEGLQPEQAPWNFKGYLWNGWHRVAITAV